MTPFEEPTRWSDATSDAPDELRAILTRGHAATTPTEGEVGALANHLSGLLGPGAPPPPPLSPMRALAHLVAKSAALKVVLVATIGTAAVVGGFELAPKRAPHAAPSAPISTTSIAPSGQSIAPSAPSIAPSAPIFAPVAPTAAPSAAPMATSSSSIAMPPPSITIAPPIIASPTPSVARSPASSARTATSVDLAPPPPTEPAPPTELELLERARRLVANRPGEALAAVREHDARYPSGRFEQESAVLEIEALVHLGRTADARARAAAFDTRFPQSAHRRRIRVLLGDGPQ